MQIYGLTAKQRKTASAAKPNAYRLPVGDLMVWFDKQKLNLHHEHTGYCGNKSRTDAFLQAF